MGRLFWFCNGFLLHLQCEIFNFPLGRLHQDNNHKTQQKSFKKQLIILFRNHIAGPLNFVKLACMCRSLNIFENNIIAYFIQPGQISVKRFFSKYYFRLRDMNGSLKFNILCIVKYWFSLRLKLQNWLALHCRALHCIAGPST